MDLAAIRAEFPVLAQWTCLNTATYGQLPTRALVAMERHWRRREEQASADFLDWYDDVDRVRASVARLIHAAPEDIAFVPNAGAALSMAVAGLPGSGTVVTADDDFPNFQYLANARKVEPQHLPEAVDPQTKLVAFSEVNYATGRRPPLEEILRATKNHGVPVFVDGSQSVGALAFDVRRTPVDILAVHAYKWLCSPTGAAFLYVSPEMRSRLASNTVGWRSHRDWRDVDNLHHGAPSFAAAAERYEGGGLPFALLFAMQAVADWMLEIGPAAIEQRVLHLAAATRDRFQAAGAAVEDNGSQIVTAALPHGLDASRVARVLRERKILIAARRGRLRIAPHFFNDENDLDRLAAALREILA